MFSLPFLTVGIVYGIVIAVYFFYGADLFYIGVCIRKQRGFLYFTCVYQGDMHLAMSMVVW